MNRFKDKKRNKGMFSFVLLLSLLLSGCGEQYAKAPELLEPVVSNESYRPVQYGDVGNTTLLNGVVVPTDYCHFWKTNTAIAKINVGIGEYVEKGTVLASANIDYVQDEIDKISAERTNYVTSYRTGCEIYELQLEELEYKLKGFQELKDKKGIKDTKTEISVLKENHRYDERLYKHKISRFDNQLSDQKEILENGTLVARTSGYVTYVKDISVSNTVKTEENVVIVSDYKDSYVEIKDIPFDTNIFERYEACQAVLDGEKHDLEEYKYLPNEELVLKSRNMIANLRAKFIDEKKTPDVGKTVPILCRKEIHEDVLYVGKDSVYQDEKGSFVYIKNGEEREVRYVETGAKDDHHVEILSGLVEGDLVYYSSEAVAPEQYDIYEATMEDYADIRKTEQILSVTTTKKIIFSDYEGEFMGMAKSDTRDIAEKELLCTIKVNEGSAALASMRNSMDKLKSAYQKQNEALEEQIEALIKQKEDIAKQEKKKKKEKKKQEKSEENGKDESKEQTDVNVAPETQQTETGDINIESVIENTGDVITPEQTVTSDNETATEQTSQETEATADGKETSGEDKDKDGGNQNSEETIPTQEEPVIRPYMIKEIERQIQCAKLNKEQAKRDYLFQLGVMQRQYNEVSSNNDGTGVMSVYSEYAGVITEVNISSGEKIEMGSRICTIEAPTSPYVFMMTEQEVSLDQEVEFVDEGLEGTFKGKVVGLTGDSATKKAFVNTIDDKVHITNSVEDGIYGTCTYGAFVKMEDPEYFKVASVSHKNKKFAKYSASNIPGVFVLPRGIVNEEVEVRTGEISYYVWKIIDDEIVKFYVQYFGESVNSEGEKIDCVLGGIKEGDKLVRLKESK